MPLAARKPLPLDQREISSCVLLEIYRSERHSKEARESAFAELYHRYSLMVYRFILQRLGDEDDAKDLLSAVWETALRQLVAFEWRDQQSDDPLRAWLYAIAARKIQEFRRLPATAPMDLLEERLNYINQYDASEEAHQNQRRGLSEYTQEQIDLLVQEALQMLNAQERDVIIQSYYGKRTSREIGELLKMTPVHVRVTLSRACKKLRALRERGILPSGHR